MDDNKLCAITDMTPPYDKEELRRFLGMVTDLTKFLPGYSQVAGPLRDLLKEDVAWCWTSVQEESLQRLQKMTTDTLVLSFYSQDAPIIVSADPSSRVIGGVLFQERKGNKRENPGKKFVRNNENSM